MTIIVSAIVIAGLGLGFVGLAFVRGGNTSKTEASGSPTPTASPTPSEPPGTQTGTINPEPGPKTVACGASAPKDALTPKPEFNAPAQVLKKNASYTATFSTSCGDVVVRLLSDTAPKTVNNFVFLAEKHYFDGQHFTRIDTSIDVIQGGDPSGTGKIGGPGYSIPDELTGNESYGPGTLAMANAGPNSGGSQFFFIVGNKGHNLDGNPAYTIFGQVVKGMAVLRRIEQIPIQDPQAVQAGDLSGQQPKLAVYMNSVTIAEKKG